MYKGDEPLYVRKGTKVRWTGIEGNGMPDSGKPKEERKDGIQGAPLASKARTGRSHPLRETTREFSQKFS